MTNLRLHQVLTQAALPQRGYVQHGGYSDKQDKAHPRSSRADTFTYPPKAAFTLLERLSYKAAFGGYVKVSALDDLRCALSCLSL